jgi:hypothetical protein
MQETANSTAKNASDPEAYQALCARAEGTTFNSQTLLATDYLNHFNEVVMLFEMIIDMPDMMDMVDEWQPKSYQDHFRESVFKEKALAIEAYDHVPPEFKIPFEATISTLNRLVDRMRREVAKLVAEGSMDRLRHIVQESNQTFQALIGRAGGIVNGSRRTINQKGIDGLLG